ncbi:hypothetical protein HMPREF9442_01697 [Paraprevotella xylaniphila YIT 11841]|uniref:Uncharacterized protein n=1 Tax=Paraprevotella xylaniphila YIT 11841 TaxID=762982 RepID=F3QU27_9BACT|nr:hypothetical protein HMPREF9442_01697 [Paraprevotella xylaniphila YIT 11841]
MPSLDGGFHTYTIGGIVEFSFFCLSTSGVQDIWHCNVSSRALIGFAFNLCCMRR